MRTSIFSKPRFFLKFFFGQFGNSKLFFFQQFNFGLAKKQLNELELIVCFKLNILNQSENNGSLYQTKGKNFGVRPPEKIKSRDSPNTGRRVAATEILEKHCMLLLRSRMQGNHQKAGGNNKILIKLKKSVFFLSFL